MKKAYKFFVIALKSLWSSQSVILYNGAQNRSPLKGSVVIFSKPTTIASESCTLMYKFASTRHDAAETISCAIFVLVMQPRIIFCLCIIMSGMNRLLLLLFSFYLNYRNALSMNLHKVC